MQPPIADPNVAPQRHFAGAETRQFRLKFWPYCLSNTMASIVVAAQILLVIELVFAEQMRMPAGAQILEWLAIVLVLAPAMCAYVWRFLPMKVDRWGLRAVTFWTTPQQVAWSQMSRARYFWAGFPYALVTCESRPKLWLWLALEEPREFAASVAEFTAPNHPLHALLIERGLIDASL